PCRAVGLPPVRCTPTPPPACPTLPLHDALPIWNNADTPLRASIVADPLGTRRNTGDNTPAVVHVEMVAGDSVHVELSSKGGGSEDRKSTRLNSSHVSISYAVVCSQEETRW